MADRLDTSRRPGGRGIAQRAYVLRPVRSRAAHIAASTLVCIACLTAGAAAVHAYDLRFASAHAPCTVSTTPAAHDDVQDALTRAQLALKQEAASRATVQKSADALAAEVGALKAQVLFLQGRRQSGR